MKMTLTGYASLFNQPDLAGDEIAPGAFTKTLAKRRDPVAMLYQHDATRPIGRWTVLQERPHGLWVEGELADGVHLAQEVFALIAQDILRGLSIGFRARRSVRGRGATKRYLHDIDLVEISLVTFPCSPRRDCTARAAGQNCGGKLKLEISVPGCRAAAADDALVKGEIHDY